MTSQYIYLNAPLPKAYEAVRIARERVCPAEDLAQLLRSNDLTLAIPEGNSIPKRLLTLFLDPDLLLGDPGYVQSDSNQWLERFAHFTDSGSAIEFVTMAFPYKSPNPLKTDRRAPDLGEALMLRRYGGLLATVGEIYEPGGRLTILEEGILGRCQGVDPRSISAYRQGIKLVVELAGIDPARLVFQSLDDMALEIPNFEARWIHEQERLRELWEHGEPEVCAAYEETFPAQRTSVPTLCYDPSVLAKAFDPEEGDSALRYVRDYVDKVAHHEFFAYRSLLALRDSSGYLHRLRPHAIKLTVSPKRGNLGVIPVNRGTEVLPYHGVPVLRADGSWDVRYIGGLGSLGSVEALRCEGDLDTAPIGYRELA